ncbi:MAG TPA: hypothetical protein VH105_02760 [Burkholderiales bacterium]|jgi:hypothetical protein|nr:hypothetical protein [Burkholderiales bacterium]
MLKLLDSLRNSALGNSRDDHPLANPKEAEHVFAELRAGDPVKALDEITHWLDSVTTAENLKPERRYELIRRLDETGQPHRGRLARDYGTLSRQSKFQEGKLWAANHDFWMRSGEAYDSLINRIEAKEKGSDALKTQAAMIAVRALRAAGTRLKWLYVRYGPIPAEVWQALARAYQFAEARRLQLGQLIVYPGLPGDASPEGEFTRALVLAASAPDALSPAELDTAERLIAHCAGKLRVTPQPQPDSTYWFDLANPRHPLRLAAPPEQITPGLRFFTTTAGHADMQAMLVRIDQTGELPRGVDLGGITDVRVVRDVLKHLVLNWAPKPPVRKSERRRIQARMVVAHGFTQLVGMMQGTGMDMVLDAVPPETETWVVENMSAGGFGAVIQQVKGDWLKIGSLLAVQPDAAGTRGSWDLAIVRRLSRDGEGAAKNQASVGVQVLARQAITVELRPQQGAWSSGNPSVEGIYMADASEPGAALLAMPPGLYMPGEQLQAAVAGRRHLLFPIGITERGDDYDMIRFRDMVEEA